MAGQAPSDSVTEVVDLITPALVVHQPTFDHNVSTMAEALPGPALRPHVKAFKSTDLARRLAEVGHVAFCAATIREIEGMVAAGMDSDLLLANEVLDHSRLGLLVERGANITAAVDSPETIDSAAAAGLQSVLIDVNVGLARCGCHPDDAGPLADSARARGLEVRGVMGYEGHLMMVADPDEKLTQVEASMVTLLDAHRVVGGPVVSAGGTGTYSINRWATEIQAGSYCLMDTHYATIGLPFDLALAVVTTVVSVSRRGWFVVDAGLKALAMDHGNPRASRGEVLFCSDEHTTIKADDAGLPALGERIALLPAHVDPTVAKHRDLWVLDHGPSDDHGSQDWWESIEDHPVVDRWSIDLTHW